MKRIHPHYRKHLAVATGWLLACLSLLPALSAGEGSRADGKTLLLLLSADSPRYLTVEERFRARLAEHCRQAPACPEVRVALADEAAQPAVTPGLVVAVGHKASNAALQGATATPQLHVMVSRSHFLERAPGAEVSAIYLEQPPDRLLAFARFLLPDRRRIGVLLGREGPWRPDRLRTIGREAGAEMQIMEVAASDEIGRRLRRLRPRIDLLLALPDPLVYNRATLATILLATFRDRIPVVGFSRGMVKAGAVAALFSSPESVGTEAADRAWRLLQGAPASRDFPSRFETAVNRRVAGALHLVLPSDREIDRWRPQP
ncbi:MAG TPA: hypothetical protein ENJ94_08300 [Gammaproteobacteria bacterium]|nr:hypothetical protein [Gammaproteobacteria bacterium]